jgi:hypothetical protein
MSKARNKACPTHTQPVLEPPIAKKGFAKNMPALLSNTVKKFSVNVIV